MGHLVEKLLWHFYQFAESYTFLLSWIAVPIGFAVGLLFLKKMSVNSPEAVGMSQPVLRVVEPLQDQALNVAEPVTEVNPEEVKAIQEPVVNKNEANA